MDREEKLREMAFQDRELNGYRGTRVESRCQYELMKAGEARAAEEHAKVLAEGEPGQLSRDPMQEQRYLFVASAALAGREAVQGGMDEARARDLRDLYIRTMDEAATAEEINALHREMFETFTREMAAPHQTGGYSRPVALCMDHIREHLHKTIRVKELAEQVGLSESYLSAIFKEETGQPISEYIQTKRVEEAESMLKFSTRSCAEIGNILAFSSQSHFIRVFKQHTGLTPRAYRNRFWENRK